MSERSLRQRSSEQQINDAFRRAVKALRGSRPLTKLAIAGRAAQYLPESSTKLYRILVELSEEAYATLVSTGTTVGTTTPEIPEEKTRPYRNQKPV